MDKLLVLTLTALIVLPGPVLANDGDLDGTFGVGGRVSSGFPDFPIATAIQSDGKIVVAGLGRGASADFALARYNFNGSLDPTFGSRGRVTTDFGGHGDLARALAIQSDGRIVAAGLAQDIYGTYGFAIARYNGDGSLDPTFGIGGKITTALPDSRINALAIQFDGKIVAAGTIDNSVTGSLGAIVRYNSDGSLDAAFGIEGKVTTKVPDSSTYVNALAIQADGKIIAAGDCASGNRSWALLARYNTDGSPDKTFGDGGRVTTDKSSIQGVALQSDGKIIAAGGTACLLRYCSMDFPEFGVARYNADGSLDTAFGDGGKAVTEFDGYLFALSLQSDGKIIAAGEAVFLGVNLFALARFNRDGSLDATFGSGGKVLSGFGGRGSRITSLGIQRDGKIVAAGFGWGEFGAQSPEWSFELARFKVDGLLLVYDVHFDSAPTISIGDSWTATLSGSNLTDETYFDLRFRSPGSNTDRVALNWQQGTAARHSIPVGTATGTWIITGVRPHLDISDHGGEFIPVSAALAVSGE
jgi:uncharacterized delta-60 repeat protein